MSPRVNCVSLVLMCLLVTALCESAASQSKSNKRRTPAKPIRRELVLTPEWPDRKIGQATVSYHDDRNQTLAVVSFIVLSKREMDMADLSVGFLVSGQKLTKPVVVEFRLKTGGNTRGIFGGPPTFELRAAGKQFKLDNVKRKRDSIVGIPEQLMSGNIPFAQFEQIAGSDQIEVRAGSLLFVLRESDRDGFRDLLKAAAGASFDK